MDLALGGVISGAGNAGTAALSNLQTTMGTNFLQQEREKYETARLQLQDQYAQQRDTTAYTRQRADTMEGRAYAEGAPERAQTQAEALQPRKSALAAREFEQEAPMRKAAAVEDVTNEVTKAVLLAQNKDWVKAQSIIKNAQESTASQAQAAKTMWDLDQGKEGAKLRDAYVKLKSDPKADPDALDRAKQAWETFSIKPGEADKIDASNAAAGLKEAGNEVIRLQSMLKDQIPGTPEYATLEHRLQNAEQSHDAFEARVRELTGTKLKAAKPAVAIKDRFKAESAPMAPSSPSAPTAPGGMITRPMAPSVP